MHDGIVEQTGEPLELYDNPANRFVATFIGSPAMNLIEGKISSAGGKPIFVTETGAKLPLANAPGASDGKPAVYGVRPEHFSVGGDGFAVTVAVVEPMGSETQLMARLGNQPIVGTFRERLQPKPGETINLRPDVSKVHLFDAATGARL